MSDQRPLTPPPGGAPQQPPKKEPKKGVTAILDSQAIEKALLNMQRSSNEAAVTELRTKQAGTLPMRVVVNAIGQLLYRIGTQAEYLFVLLLRAFKRIAAAVFMVFTSIIGAFTTPVLHFFGSMMHDITEPWRKIVQGLRHARHTMRESEEGRAAGLRQIRQGIRLNRHVLLGALNWIFPVGAALVFTFTVHQMLLNGFSLRVTYNGEVIGFVEADTVWDSAVKIVNSRIIASNDENVDASWLAKPSFSIVPVDPAARSSATVMADTLISQSSDQIQNATGVTVDGTLVGVAEGAAELQAALDSLLAPYQTGAAGHEASFAHDIQLVSGVYYTSSIHTVDEVVAMLRSVPEYLQVKTVDIEEYDTEIPIEVVEQPSDQYYVGVRRTIQRGEEGEQHVVARVTRIDGTEVSREPIETTVIEEMQPEIVVVGTKEKLSSIGQVGSGEWTFPVPGYRGHSTYPGHRGEDIQADYGTPIYAAEGGTVLKAEYHRSWGNYVLIDHHNGLYSLYGHCSSLAVVAGQEVGRGELIAYIGSTGNSFGNHLHIEVWSDPSGSWSCLLNPLDFVTPPNG